MEDYKINPEGLPNYVLPSPLPMKTSQEPMQCTAPIPATEPEDMLPEEGPEPTVGDIDILDHVMINPEIRRYYDRWYIGRITWYNTQFGEYRVLFREKFEDYIE